MSPQGQKGGGVCSMPTPAEVARVDAWRVEQQRVAEERERAVRERAACPIHGHAGRQIYGPAPWGYGMTCRICRRQWSRREGRPWESEQQSRARQQREHAALVADIESMSPAEFYAEWADLRQRRHEATRRYHYDAPPDEFGVNHFGSATSDGRRYYAMRDRVRREARAFEEARDAI